MNRKRAEMISWHWPFGFGRGNLFLIQPHSFVDIITNSSSELFIMKTEKTLKFIKEVLQDSLDLYNKTADEHRTFNETFGDIFVVSSRTPVDKIDELISTLADYRVPTYISFLTYPDYDDCQKMSDTGETWEEARKNWLKNHRKGFIKSCEGLVVVYSEGDNTVPEEVMDFIEQSLNADRIHLG
jgi:hypothetical protein